MIDIYYGESWEKINLFLKVGCKNSWILYRNNFNARKF